MNRYERLRYERGVSRADLAAATGLHRNTLAGLENGLVERPSAATAKALADFYEISVFELLGVEEREVA